MPAPAPPAIEEPWIDRLTKHTPLLMFASSVIGLATAAAGVFTVVKYAQLAHSMKGKR